MLFFNGEQPSVLRVSHIFIHTYSLLDIVYGATRPAKQKKGKTHHKNMICTVCELSSLFKGSLFAKSFINKLARHIYIFEAKHKNTRFLLLIFCVVSIFCQKAVCREMKVWCMKSCAAEQQHAGREGKERECVWEINMKIWYSRQALVGAAH